MNDEQLLNLDTLRGLREIERQSAGAPFVESLIEDYLAQVGSELQAIEVARSSGDAERLRKSIHAALGAAMAVGAQGLVDCLQSEAFRGNDCGQHARATAAAERVAHALRGWLSTG
jgi:hypothetical protein